MPEPIRSFPVAFDGLAFVVSTGGDVIEISADFERLARYCRLPARFADLFQPSDADGFVRFLSSTDRHDRLFGTRLYTRALDWCAVDVRVLAEAAEPPRRYLCAVALGDLHPQAGRVRELREFLGVAGHRLFNLLPSAKGRVDSWVEMAKSRGLATSQSRDELQRAASLLDVATDVSLELKNQTSLADFALESRGFVIELLMHLEQELRATFGATIRLTTRVYAPDQPVRYNFKKLFETFVSFVVDSQGFCPGVPDLGLQVSKDGPHVVLVYTDNGPGVPDEWKERMFEPYRSSRGGTGLGMYIARRIVERHNGTLCETGVARHGIHLELRLPIATR